MNRQQRRAQKAGTKDLLLPVILGSDFKALIGNDAEAQKFAMHAFQAVVENSGGKIPATGQRVYRVKLRMRDGDDIQLVLTADVGAAVQVGLESDFARVSPEEYQERFDDMAPPPPISDLGPLQPFPTTPKVH